MPLRNAKRERDRSAAGRPVFVDASGRRLRHTRIAGLITVTVVVAYIGLVGSAFLGAPNIIGPLLPEAIASQKRPAAHARALPTEPPTSHSPSVPAPRTSAPQVQVPVPAPAPVSTAAPSPSPSPSTSPTSAPGRSATAPGQAN